MRSRVRYRRRRTRRASILGLAPPPSETRRTELADFLRHRRGLVSPESAGLEANGRRRTPGLRREEVAQLAGVGLSWYTWLEQGRDIKPSAPGARRARPRAAARHRRARAPVPSRPRRAAAARRRLPARGAAGAGRRGRGRSRRTPPTCSGPRTDVLAWNRAAATRDRRAERRARTGSCNLLWWLFTTDAPRGATWQDDRPQHARALPRRARAPHRRPGLRRAGRGARRGERGLPRLVAAPRGARRAARDEDDRASRARARCGCTTCSRCRPAIPTCGSPSSRPPTRRRGPRWAAIG